MRSLGTGVVMSFLMVVYTATPVYAVPHSCARHGLMIVKYVPKGDTRMKNGKSLPEK